jgi:hypothetical protein
MAQITVNDARTPVDPAENTLTSRVPLGAFIAYNGTVEDGQRKRAVVVDHDEESNSVTVQDGTERVTITGDELENVVILASSADGFAQRVSQKAETLGRVHSWCDVARAAVRELNNEPEQVNRGSIYVEVSIKVPFELLPTRYMTENVGLDDEHVTRYLRETFHPDWSYAFNRDYFRPQGDPSRDAVITIERVDAPNQETSPEAS